MKPKTIVSLVISALLVFLSTHNSRVIDEDHLIFALAGVWLIHTLV